MESEIKNNGQNTRLQWATVTLVHSVLNISNNIRRVQTL